MASGWFLGVSFGVPSGFSGTPREETQGVFVRGFHVASFVRANLLGSDTVSAKGVENDHFQPLTSQEVVDLDRSICWTT